ncbi:MAG TPA: DUF2784 domain-containing protein [Candidatus Sulfotelmatobacter sp.]|nr:DUF2784 domain-containing protein [Candidatus Sulfotelmatobacter sp.]
MRTLYLLLADVILVAHALIVLFNLGALPIIWLGALRHWRFVRNFAFRLTHLLLIAFIAAETLLGTVCPLTTWENQWRLKAGVDPLYQGDFITHWVHWLIFYDIDERWFIAAYVLFFVLVLLTFLGVKPRPPRRCSSARG